jgi:hypothetical protein
MRNFKLWTALAVCTVLAACGGGGGGSGSSSSSNTTVNGSTSYSQVIASPGSNAAVMTVAAAPANSGVVVANVPMVSVTICLPSSPSTCATINNIQVDTGSSGFRVLSSALDSAFTSTTWQAGLPQVTAPTTGDPEAECMTFADGIAFGGVRKANLTVASESASNLNIEVIGDSAAQQPTSGQVVSGQTADAQTALASCEHLANQSTPQTLHANGVLGVGTAVDDCYYCHSGGNATPMYYHCATSTTCNNLNGTTLSSANLVTNPVASFPTDNNGVIVELPPVGASGAATATGVLVFGIGTASNNGLGSAQVFGADPINGNITTSFQGNTYENSFFDSGSNSLFFTASIATCADSSTFYCPSSTQALSAMIEGTNGVNATLNFSVANTDTLTQSGNYAFDNQAGTLGTYFSSNATFDWGLPAFYGRNVYTAMVGKNTPGGAGPYYAF